MTRSIYLSLPLPPLIPLPSRFPLTHSRSPNTTLPLSLLTLQLLPRLSKVVPKVLPLRLNLLRLPGLSRSGKIVPEVQLVCVWAPDASGGRVSC